MARNEIVEQQVLEATGVFDDPELQEEAADEAPAPYHLVGSSSIPVSRKLGSKYKAQIDDALQAFDPQRLSWDRAYTSYRACSGDDIRFEDTESRPTNYFANETDENLTRETVKTLLRNTYSHNPTINLATIDGSDDPQIDTYNAVINELLGRVQHPGLNAKARIRRWIMHGHLTNFGILRLDFQAMVGSRAEAQATLLELQEKCSEEKELDKLDELYAELEQAEEQLSTTRDPGMILNNIQSHSLVIDPDAKYSDTSDWKYTHEYIMLSDSYIKKRYMKKSETGAWVRIVDNKVPGSGFDGQNKNEKDVRDVIVDKIMGATPESIAQARYKDKTLCVLTHDKLTRLISLWIDGSWDCPLYVWRDDLHLSRFFPYFVMSFAEPVDSVVQEGEQAQYYGMEKEINKINRRVAFIRRLAYGSLIYNSRKIDATAVKQVVNHMKSSNEFDAFGIDWDPAGKLTDMFEVFVPPDAQLQSLYDKSDLMKNVNRINNQSEVSQGGQFKTNTTNKAVAAYSANQASVKNELTDSVEDALKDLIWSMLEIVASKYTKEQVLGLVGPALAENFKPMTVEEFNNTYSCEIAPGSTEKPSSENMKAEAMSMAQAIGQVGQATPMTTLKIIFRMFSKAFSNFSFRKEDEAMLNEEAQANLTKGVSTPNGAPPQGGQPPAAPPAPTGPVA